MTEMASGPYTVFVSPTAKRLLWRDAELLWKIHIS